MEDIIYGKKTTELSKKERKFYNDTINHELNPCDICEIIYNTWEELYWDCDFDLKGHTALCYNCYHQQLNN